MESSIASLLHLMFMNDVHEMYKSCLRYRRQPWDFSIREALHVIIPQASMILHSCLLGNTVFRGGMENLRPNPSPQCLRYSLMVL